MDLSEEEKRLLLLSINCYLEKMSFVFKNRKYYMADDFLFSTFKEDVVVLSNLRDKFLSVETSLIKE